MSGAIDVLNPDKPKRVLLLASNSAVAEQTGWPIGFWWGELAHPYWEFVEHKFQMDVREIRTAILGGETRVEQIRQFHRNRVHVIESGYAVAGGDLSNRKGILLHLLPLGAFDLGTWHELGEELLRDRDVRPPRPRA